MLAAVLAISLQALNNEELAATNNAVQMWGRVQPQNLAFEKLKKLSLIRENGELWDAEPMKTACAFEVNRRVEAGTFN